MIVGGDVGGTKTLLGIFEPAADRPRVVATHNYRNSEFGSFREILDEFRRAVGASVSVETAVVGVAGPVVGNAASLTNISWDITATGIGAGLGATRVEVLNDLEALANAVREAGRAERVSDPVPAGTGRRGHLRVLRSPES